jgi:membrane-associated protease RseP (regulator of RpoE activity)
MSEPIPPVSSTAELSRPIEVFVVHPQKHRYWIHILLLAATFFTTLVVGARMEFNFLHRLPVFYLGEDSLSIFPMIWALQLPHLLLGIPFAFTLMLILLAHEMGHYLYCRRYRVWATLPFFIPFPTLIGTLGAFIRIRSPIRSRSALFDIGIAGPIAGFVVSVIVLFFSLALSQPASPIQSVESIQFGLPLIFYSVHELLSALGMAHGIAALPLSQVELHPVAIAAWVGMFATALNLLPGGQLDGGHMVFSLAPRVHRLVSRVTILALIPMAIFYWAGWLLWAVLLGLSGLRHPMVPEWPGVDGSRRWLAIFGLLMLVLTFAPAPFLHSSLLDVIQQFRTGH